MTLHKKILEHSKRIYFKAKKRISDSKNQKNVAPLKKDISFPQLLEEAETLTQKTLTEIHLLSAIKIISVIFGIIILGRILTTTSDIIISFFLALFFSAALFPGVEYLEKKKIPRSLSIFILFLGVIGAFIFLISNLLPALIDQIITLGEWIRSDIKEIYFGNYSSLPDFLQKYGPNIQEYIRGFDEYLKNLQNDSEAQKGLVQMIGDSFAPWKDGITTFFGKFLSFLSNLFIILILAFFILLDRESLKIFFLSSFSPHTQKYVAQKTVQMQSKIAQWIHGQMILFMFMGGVTWIVLTLLGVDYALTLGFLAGMAEFVPYLGPSMSFLVTVPIAFGSGPETGVAVMIFFAILQIIEGNILVPMVMKKAIGIPPIVTILAMLVGFEFLGVIGAVLAIPIASILGIFIWDIQQKESKFFEKNENENEKIEKKKEKK